MKPGGGCLLVRSPTHCHSFPPCPALYDCSPGLAGWGYQAPRVLTFLKTRLMEGEDPPEGVISGTVMPLVGKTWRRGGHFLQTVSDPGLAPGVHACSEKGDPAPLTSPRSHWVSSSQQGNRFCLCTCLLGLCGDRRSEGGARHLRGAGWDSGCRLAGQVWWGAICPLGSLAWAQACGVCLHDLIKSV